MRDRQHGAALTDEVNIFYELCPGPLDTISVEPLLDPRTHPLASFQLCQDPKCI